MILEFSVTNFRSIREKQTFSMLAYGSQSKLDNTFEVELANGDTIRLVKTAGIYGANSFGKSNLIHAFFNFIRLIQTSADTKVGDEVSYYDPFLFHMTSRNAPTEFEVIFIGRSKEKFKYSVTFNRTEILIETLDYYPQKNKNNIFKRFTNNNLVHQAKLSKKFGNKEYELYRNQLLLSKFSKDIPNEVIANIFLYFTKIDIWNVLNKQSINILRRDIIQKMKFRGNSFQKRLNKLVKIADTKIDSLVLQPVKAVDLPTDLPDEIKNKVIGLNQELYARHFVYDDDKQIVSYEDVKFSEESVGTNMLFAIGGAILEKLEDGGIIVIDEFDASMHPALSRFLITLFNHPISNPNKAQLIFVSHEPHILDKNYMRADQIWFADKNEFGETEIYSAQDFDSVREDIPFDKWYLAGKFGAVPHIHESDIQFIFEDEK